MISVITPVHQLSLPFLREAYESLVKQTFADWQWVLVANGGAEIPDDLAQDRRVLPFRVGDDGVQGRHNRIGRLKKFGVSQSAGEILVELDADDILVAHALERVAGAFADPETAMVYSNAAEFKTGTWENHVYSEYWGWRSRLFSWNGYALREMIAWEPSAHMMRYIYWAPNHVRAWRRSAYEAVGGHDEALAIGDDHDLCCRFYIRYGARGLKHLDECLYLYRIHNANSCRLHNEEVQQQTLANYVRYSRTMMARWARDEGLRLVDLGGCSDPWNGFEVVPFQAPQFAFPLEDQSVGVLRAAHVLQFLPEPVQAMNEAFRVLAPGGWLLIEVPSTDGRGAFQDPRHRSFWNENSFWYYTRENFARFIRPAYKGRFQESRIVTYFPSDFERQNKIPVVQADLIALKPPYDQRPVGEVLI